MAEMKLKNGDSQTMKISESFKGFSIGLVAVRDDNAPVTAADKMNLSEIQITLENRVTREKIYSASLAEWIIATRWSDRDLLNVLQQNDNVSLVPEKTISPCNIPLDTYEGKYSVKVEMGSAVAAGTFANSFLTITPDWSVDSMEYEVHYADYSLDNANFNETLENGIEEVILTDPFTAGYAATDAFYSSFARTSYTAKENSEAYNNEALRVVTAGHMEEAVPACNILVLHDGEVLNDVKVSLEQSAPNSNYRLVYRRLVANPAAEVSYKNAVQKKNASLDRIPEMKI